MLIETKSEFARRLGVTPARVSQYLAEGTITPEALEGAGPRARIRVDRALADVKSRLDPSQRFGLNGKAGRGAADGDPDGKLVDPIAEQRLRQAEMTTRRMAREEAASAGRYILADDHRRGVAEVSGRLLQAIEGGLPELAQAIAEHFDVPQRDAVHVIRTAFRDVRKRAAAAVRQEAAAMPETVADTVIGPDVEGHG